MKLKFYTATFIGRSRRAIGETYWHTITVVGINEDDARINLYETHEHISNLTLNYTGADSGEQGRDY